MASALMDEALRARESRVERRINVVRALVVAPLVIADLAYAWVAGIRGNSLVSEYLLISPASPFYFALVARLTRDTVYRAWLMYLTATVDCVRIRGQGRSRRLIVPV